MNAEVLRFLDAFFTPPPFLPIKVLPSPQTTLLPPGGLTVLPAAGAAPFRVYRSPPAALPFGPELNCGLPLAAPDLTLVSKQTAGDLGLGLCPGARRTRHAFAGSRWIA